VTLRLDKGREKKEGFYLIVRKNREKKDCSKIWADVGRRGSLCRGSQLFRGGDGDQGGVQRGMVGGRGRRKKRAVLVA